MAEGGYDPETTNPFEPHGDDHDDHDDHDDEDGNENIPLITREKGKKRRGKYYALPKDVPGYIGTSTNKKGEQETSFGGEDLLREKQKERDELEKEILDVFPHIKKKLLPHIFKDDYGRLVYKGDKTFKDGVDRNKPHIIAEGGRPSHDYSLGKFPKGLKRDLGRTNVEINQEVYEKQKKEEEKQAKREQEREQIRVKLVDNDDKLADAIERQDNLRRVIKEQEEAREHSLTAEDKESLTSRIEVNREAYTQVSKEINETRVERDRLEKTERNADEMVQDGERQVETARERVNQRLLSLRDRIKEIFKKHGFTVVAVVSAIGVVIGVIVSSLKAGLGKLADGVGNGLKELGSKLAESLPGMIGSIASLIFKTAGEVIKFLGKNAWLLIVGLVVFVVEMIKKKLKVSKRKKDQDHEPGKNTVHVTIH